MPRFSFKTSLALGFLGLAACGRAPAPPAAPAATAAAAHEDLNRIVDRYWDEHAPAGVAISPQSLADSLARERRFLAEVLAIPRARLDPDAGLTYDIFKRQRETAIEGFTYPSELTPVNPFDSMPVEFAREARSFGRQPLKSAKDYGVWQLRIDEYAAWTQQAIVNMREGMRRGYTSPRVLMERMLPLLQGLGEDTSANVFYTALTTLPESVHEPDRTRLSGGLEGAVKGKLLPAYRELHDFIQREYLPRARVSVGLSALPLGPSWYAARVKRATGSSLRPDEVHRIGLAEVERIHGRLLALPAPTAPPGAAAGLSNEYQEWKAQTLAAMPKLFTAMPPEDFDVGTPATGDVVGFLAEAIPGRRYQAALQQQRIDLPKFRRFGSDLAFVEGWALYATSLGEELGLYRDDEAKRGALLGQMKCAAALVVDTGLHAEGWTRAQAAAYVAAQLAADDAGANLLTDRWMALPGDALACKMGELKIQSLLAQARQLLGPRFDIREFHSQLLKDGAMPLDILEPKMKLWMEAQR